MIRSHSLVLALAFALGVSARPGPAGSPGGPAFMPMLVPVPPGPERIETGDFDGDGDLDLMVLTRTPSTSRAFVLENQNGTFSAGWNLLYPPSIQGSPTDLEVGDMDGDLDLDVLINIPYAAGEVRFNAGDGTFPTSAGFPIAGRRIDHELEDFDGDGDLDLAYFELDLIGYLGAAQNPGNGVFPGFGPEITVSGFDPKLRSALGEVTGDARTDIVLGSSGGLQVVAGSTVGAQQAWTSPPTLLESGTFGEVVVADLDGDQINDIVAANQTADGVTVVPGILGGGFGPSSLLPTGPKPEALVATDIGSGPALDIAVLDARRGLLSVLVGNGDGTFQAPANFFVGRNPRGIAAGDFDADGDQDLFVTSAGRVVVLINQETP